MKVESTGAVLSTVFVDYDNIYLSLKRKNEEAAKRFAKDAALWLREIESGRLITPTNGSNFTLPRRIVMTRCYGNPVPRRNTSDNSTDMNSFPFVRHHFLRAGFEVVDCPPLTAQLKNSADIRMVMDVRDVLNHETRFDEFILLSGDADFTPVLHRLRAHARRTVVFANDHTAQPYTAISDGEIREADLISLLLEGRIESEPRSGGELREPTAAELEGMRKSIVAEVVGTVRSAGQPVPLEALADRAVRTLGHEKTVGSAWGGAGSFRDLLARALPKDVRLTDQPPYFAYEPTRQIAREIEARPEAPAQRERRPETQESRYEPRFDAPPARTAEARPDFTRESRPEPQPQYAPQRAERAPAPRYDDPRFAPPRDEPARPPQQASRPDAAMPTYGQSGFFAPPPDRAPLGMPAPRGQDIPAYGAPPPPPAADTAARQRTGTAPLTRSADQASQIQQSIARIHEACQAPPLSPPEYRVLFEVMAEEITTNNLSGQQTLINIMERAREMGLEVRRDDVRFVLEVVSEADPWFEQGASANLFASRFRNFVVARCRSQGLNLSADEIDLIDAWFGGAPASQRAAQGAQQPARPAAPPPQAYGTPPPPPAADRWSSPPSAPPASQFGAENEEEFPRIVRSRLRG
ncbi:NYN domain-containing protein [Hyphomicrobium sp.]|uniref:NYN domain-containing protein n=1 Tax=Hyphomicrobium sp. TaxID=82 RepID=UPI0025BA427A|nr:NYN domain-containing protein [Hyphomicrobium sp.]MCC7253014.1 NYN domain-containing protein [Hyphomicrobium sp.]